LLLLLLLSDGDGLAKFLFVLTWMTGSIILSQQQSLARYVQ
jgi:hypothetical protein